MTRTRLLHRTAAGVALSLSLLGSLLLPCASAEQIYRWKDDQGITHYSSSPPNDRAASQLDLGGDAPGPDSGETARQRLQEEIERANRMTADRRQKAATAEAQQRHAREEARRRVERCGLARQQLGVLIRGGPVFSLDRAGNRNYLDDDDRDRAIERARQEVRDACQGVPATAGQDAAGRAERSLERATRCLELRERLDEVTRPGSRVGQAEAEQIRDAYARLCGKP